MFLGERFVFVSSPCLDSAILRSLVAPPLSKLITIAAASDCFPLHPKYHFTREHVFDDVRTECDRLTGVRVHVYACIGLSQACVCALESTVCVCVCVCTISPSYAYVSPVLLHSSRVVSSDGNDKYEHQQHSTRCILSASKMTWRLIIYCFKSTTASDLM